MSLPPANMQDGTFDELLLSIIIVNYNGLPFLETCLRSLSQNVPCPHEIIIVDNNSSDGSREYLLDAWPDVQLISSSENKGFARGNNLGAKNARGKYLLLLNNDTKLLESLQPLLDYFEDHPETAVVGCRLRNPDGSIQTSVGYDHTPFRILFSWILPRTFSWFSDWQIYEKHPAFYKHNHEDVHWVTGAFLCIRKRTWQSLSGFDQDIFMYVEDVDLCRRVRERGERVAYIAGADTCHFEGGGKKGISENALMATIDSYRLLLTKQYGYLTRTLTCSILSAIFLIRAVLYTFFGLMNRDPASSRKAGFYLKGAGRLVFGGVERPVHANSGDQQ